MLPVKAGDVIGMHAHGHLRHIAANIHSGQLDHGDELEMDTVLECRVKSSHDRDLINSDSCSEIQRAYALRAIVQQNWTLGMLLFVC